MSDISHHGVRQRVPLRTHLADSLGIFLHLLRLLWQAWNRDGVRSIEAKLSTGEHVSLAQGFRLDGTTFVVARDDDSTRRIPASMIEEIVDRGDYGYA